MAAEAAGAGGGGDGGGWWFSSEEYRAFSAGPRGPGDGFAPVSFPAEAWGTCPSPTSAAKTGRVQRGILATQPTCLDAATRQRLLDLERRKASLSPIEDHEFRRLEARLVAEQSLFQQLLRLYPNVIQGRYTVLSAPVQAHSTARIARLKARAALFPPIYGRAEVLGIAPGVVGPNDPVFTLLQRCSPAAQERVLRDLAADLIGRPVDPKRPALHLHASARATRGTGAEAAEPHTSGSEDEEDGAMLEITDTNEHQGATVQPTEQPAARQASHAASRPPDGMDAMDQDAEAAGEPQAAATPSPPGPLVEVHVDATAARLARQHKAGCVITEEAFVALIASYFPPFRTEWTLPITVAPQQPASDMPLVYIGDPLCKPGYAHRELNEDYASSALLEHLATDSAHGDALAAPSYSTWSFGTEMTLLVRAGTGHRLRHGGATVHLAAKVQYLHDVGPEEMSLREVSTIWARAYLRNCSQIMLAHVKPDDGGVIGFKLYTLPAILNANPQFRPDVALNTFRRILDRACRLTLGTHIATHATGESHIVFRRAVEGEPGGVSFDLHAQQEEAGAALKDIDFLPAPTSWAAPEALPFTFPADRTQSRTRARYCYKFTLSGSCDAKPCLYPHLSAEQVLLLGLSTKPKKPAKPTRSGKQQQQAQPRRTRATNPNRGKRKRR